MALTNNGYTPYYSYPYGNSYNPQVGGRQNSTASPMFSQTIPVNTYDWVQGEEAARSYPVPNGAEATLMDSDKPVMYKKSVDVYGVPSLEVYDIVLRNKPANDYVTKDEIDTIVADAVRKELNKHKKFKENSNG